MPLSPAVLLAKLADRAGRARVDTLQAALAIVIADAQQPYRRLAFTVLRPDEAEVWADDVADPAVHAGFEVEGAGNPAAMCSCSWRCCCPGRGSCLQSARRGTRTRARAAARACWDPPAPAARSCAVVPGSPGRTCGDSRSHTRKSARHSGPAARHRLRRGAARLDERQDHQSTQSGYRRNHQRLRGEADPPAHSPDQPP
jgi:hypothetical protein